MSTHLWFFSYHPIFFNVSFISAYVRLISGLCQITFICTALIHQISDCQLVFNGFHLEYTFQNPTQKLWRLHNNYFHINTPPLIFYNQTYSCTDYSNAQHSYQKVSRYHIRHKQSAPQCNKEKSRAV